MWVDTYHAALVKEWLYDQTSQPPAKGQLRHMAELLWGNIADEVTEGPRTIRQKTYTDLARQRCSFAKLQNAINPFVRS